MINSVRRLLPRNWVRAVGALQHRVPGLQGIFKLLKRGTGSAGTIMHGPGKGLAFDTTGGPLGLLFGTVDEAEQIALANELKSGQTFYDIGANIGIYAVIASRIVGASGTVVAFEPNESSMNACRNNCLSNELTNVQFVQSAVGNTNGTIQLSFGDSSTTNNVREMSSHGVEVPLVTIDALMAKKDIPIPHVVMIDVEGAEIDVLEGMIDTIAKFKPVIFVEVHWLGKKFVDFIDSKIIPLGYVAKCIDGSEMISSNERYHAILKPHEVALNV